MSDGLILFVDDDEFILKAYRRRFRKSFNFITAVGPQQGIPLLDEHQFTAVVSDIMMPEIDGFEFLKIVRSRQPTAIRIILSGSCDEATLQDAITSGLAHSYIEKGSLDLDHELSAAIKVYNERTRK